jgi:PKD repeat protein
MGDKNTAGSGLFITQGSKLIADGTASNPIVFTSNQPAGQRALGDWGGIILMGKSTNNNAGGIANIEGLAPTFDTQYGGGANPDANDNSGILRYVRIEFPGYVYQPNKEINGLTLGSVGRATTIDYVQVSFSNDDAYEWFGGTVNCRHLVSYRNLDDDFDTDNGFSGLVQYCLAVRDPLIADNPTVSTSEGFESDNDASGSANSPQTSAIFSNVTYVGPLRGNTAATVASGFRRGARIRRNSGLKIYNSIFMDGLRGVHIDGTACEANATNGVLKYKNNLVAGYITNYSVERNAGSTFGISAWFGANNNDSLASSANILTLPYGVNNTYLSPDFRPVTASSALSNISFLDASINPVTIPAPTTTTALNYCQGATANALTATGNQDCTINWYTTATGGTSIPAPTPSTTTAGTFNYYVAQMNAAGYEGPRVMVTVTVNALPATPIISANGPTSFCTGGSVDLTSSSSTGNVWSTTATTATISVTSSGSYSVTVTDVNGCSASSAATTVNVSNAPAPTINASATQACAGETVTISASTSDSYLWSTGATTQSIDVTATAANITVTTTNANACNGVGTSAPISVTFNATPTAAGTMTLAGNVATFTNTSAGATSYSWDFGDFTNSSATAPAHAYAVNGTYTVVLTAINGNCSDTATFLVDVTVGLNELTSSNMKVFPNPATEQVAVSFEQTTELVAIELIDATGRVMFSQTSATIGSNVVSFPVSTLSAGFYTVRMTNASGIATEKLMIQK